MARRTRALPAWGGTMAMARAVLLQVVLAALPLGALANCRSHEPCCICMSNVCGKHKSPMSQCANCTATHEALLVGPICNCEPADFIPWCETSHWGCECHHGDGSNHAATAATAAGQPTWLQPARPPSPPNCMCVPSVAGEFVSKADCVFDGCPSSKPPPPPGPKGGLQVPAIFADDMVLQAESSTIHGAAPPGALVTLAALPARAGFPLHATASSSGVWAIVIGAQARLSPVRRISQKQKSPTAIRHPTLCATLRARTSSWQCGLAVRRAAWDDGSLWGVSVLFAIQAASLDPTDLTISSAGQPPFALRRVLWGDVYLCSGQSNMLIPASYILQNESAIEAAIALNASLRMLYVQPGVQRATPQNNVGPLVFSWSRPSTTNRHAVGAFSAVCLTFALGLVAQKPELSSRPMGLVVSAASGTPVEAWMTPESVANCPDVPSDAGCSNTGNLTSGLYNGQIHPFHKMAFKLAIWYQGESNALWGQFPDDAHTASSGYICRYSQLISGWRTAMNFVAATGDRTVRTVPILGPRTIVGRFNCIQMILCFAHRWQTGR